MRFSDKLDLEDYLEVMGGISIAAINSSELPRFRLRLRRIGNYWGFARSLIPREIGGNEYIDINGDAKIVLPELPQQVVDVRGLGTLFRDTMKAVCFDGQDAPDPHFISTKFHRSCTDNVAGDISGGANALPLPRIFDRRPLDRP